MHAAHAQGAFVERREAKGIGLAVSHQRHTLCKGINHVSAVVGVGDGFGEGG